MRGKTRRNWLTILEDPPPKYASSADFSLYLIKHGLAFPVWNLLLTGIPVLHYNPDGKIDRPRIKDSSGT